MSQYVELLFTFPGYKPYKVYALYDTGCSLLLAKYGVFPPETWQKGQTQILSYANQQQQKVSSIAKNVMFQLGSQTYTATFTLHDPMKYDIMLGNKFWLALARDYLFLTETQGRTRNNVFSFHYTYYPMELQPWHHQTSHTRKCGDMVTIATTITKPVADAESPSVEQAKKGKMEKILKVLSLNFSDNPLALYKENHPKCKLEVLPMDVLKQKRLSVPVRIKARPGTPIDEIDFKMHLDEMLKYKLIQPSTSAWSSPAFMVRNHSEIIGGKSRMVIDYSKLNQVLVKNAYRIPYRDSLMLRLRNSKYYTKLDCKSGFFQVKMEDESIPITAFSTPLGNYEWLVMPMGLHNAPSIFQKKMDDVLRDHTEYCIVYIDDILIHSKSEKSHLDHVLAVAKTLADNGIVISKKKAIFNQQKIEFLGSVIHEGRIVLQPHVLEKLDSYPEQIHTRKELQTFLGLINYAAKDYLPNLSILKEPLQKKLRGNEIFKWTNEDSLNLKKIKNACKNLPMLYLPNDEDELVIMTDASDVGWAGVLLANNRVSRYASGTWSQQEKNWTAFDKELRAIVKTLRSFQIFLYKPFTLKTDCKAVIGFINNTKLDNKDHSAKQIRDKLSILRYADRMQLKHIAGNQNYIADTLTRALLDKKKSEKMELVNQIKILQNKLQKQSIYSQDENE